MAMTQIKLVFNLKLFILHLATGNKNLDELNGVKYSITN